MKKEPEPPAETVKQEEREQATKSSAPAPPNKPPPEKRARLQWQPYLSDTGKVAHSSAKSYITHWENDLRHLCYLPNSLLIWSIFRILKIKGVSCLCQCWDSFYAAALVLCPWWASSSCSTNKQFEVGEVFFFFFYDDKLTSASVSAYCQHHLNVSVVVTSEDHLIRCLLYKQDVSSHLPSKWPLDPNMACSFQTLSSPSEEMPCFCMVFFNIH